MNVIHAERELEGITRDGIRPLLAGVSLMFIASMPAIVSLLPPGSGAVIAVGAAGSLGLLLGGLWVALHSRPIPAGSGHAVATGIVLVVAAYLTLRGHLHPGPQHTPNFMLLIVAAGALILSTRWYSVAMALALAAWASFAIPWGPESGPQAFGVVNAAILSVVIHVTRRRAMLRLIGARAEAADLALKDELTGLRNRRAFFEIGAEHVAIARRGGRGSTILFVDVDGLKQINDRLGHGAGDTALRFVAAALQDSFRESDLIARLGGDEFAVLLPGSGGASRAILARLDGALMTAGQAIPEARLAVSVGSAVIEPTSDEDLSVALERADGVMYERRLRHLQPVV